MASLSTVGVPTAWQNFLSSPPEALQLPGCFDQRDMQTFATAVRSRAGIESTNGNELLEKELSKFAELWQELISRRKHFANALRQYLESQKASRQLEIQNGRLLMEFRLLATRVAAANPVVPRGGGHQPEHQPSPGAAPMAGQPVQPMQLAEPMQQAQPAQGAQLAHQASSGPVSLAPPRSLPLLPPLLPPPPPPSRRVAPLAPAELLAGSPAELLAAAGDHLPSEEAEPTDDQPADNGSASSRRRRRRRRRTRRGVVAGWGGLPFMGPAVVTSMTARLPTAALAA